MTLEEIKQLKTATEQNIAVLLHNFNNNKGKFIC